MRRRPSNLQAIGLLLAMATVACGGSSGDPAGGVVSIPTVQVAFVYLASTVTDPAVAAAFPGCVANVGQTHFHPSWRSFARVNMTAVGAGSWEITFDDVPVQQGLSLRISDPNACATDPNGASTVNVFGNAVLLTNIVSTPGNGLEPGLAFDVAADGTVSP